MDAPSIQMALCRLGTLAVQNAKESMHKKSRDRGVNVHSETSFFNV